MKIPTMPLFTPGKQYTFADLPNTEGFTVTARHLSGQNFPAVVCKDDSGCHYLADMLGNRIKPAAVTGWHIASHSRP